MTTPTTLTDWGAHCRAQAAAWDRECQSASHAGALELAAQNDSDAAAWRSLALLLAHVSRSDAMSSGVWPEQLTAAAAAVAAHLPTTTERSTR